jgi:hypothetical protein
MSEALRERVAHPCGCVFYLHHEGDADPRFEALPCEEHAGIETLSARNVRRYFSEWPPTPARVTLAARRASG